MRQIGLISIVVLALVCGACAPYSHGHLYGVAGAAVKAQTNLPPSAVIGSIRNAEFYVGKNAACVYVPVEYTDSSGGKKSENYIVWLKRICTRWEMDRCSPEPDYSAAQ